VVLGVTLLWTVVPLAWMVLLSLKPSEDLTASSPQLTFTPTLEHYDPLVSGGNNSGPYIRNSLTPRACPQPSRLRSGAWPGTVSRAAASAAKTT
jgi:hypothetical protein